MNIFKKRVIAKSVVGVSVGVVKQRKGTESIVEVCVQAGAEPVIDKGVGSVGAVLCAVDVEQERRSASGRIGIRSIEDQRSAAKPGVVAAGGILKERIPAKCCVSSAGGEVKKCFAPFR